MISNGPTYRPNPLEPKTRFFLFFNIIAREHGGTFVQFRTPTRTSHAPDNVHDTVNLNAIKGIFFNGPPPVLTRRASSSLSFRSLSAGAARNKNQRLILATCARSRSLDFPYTRSFARPRYIRPIRGAIYGAVTEPPYSPTLGRRAYPLAFPRAHRRADILLPPPPSLTIPRTKCAPVCCSPLSPALSLSLSLSLSFLRF